MKTFSFRKYLTLLRSSLLVDWKAHMVFAVLLILLFYVFFLFYNTLANATVAGMSSDEMMINLGVYGFLKIIIILFIVAVVVGFSSAHSVYFLGTQNSAYSSIMRPATKVERFAVVMTRSFLISVIDAFIAFVIADLLQWITTGNFPVDYYGDIDWNYVSQTNALPDGTEVLLHKGIAAATTSILFCSAWFSFCATTFSRHPFIFGMLLLWVMAQLVSLAIFFIIGFSAVLDYWEEKGIDDIGKTLIITKLDSFTTWVIALLALASIFFWIVSYVRMKNFATAKYE